MNSFTKATNPPTTETKVWDVSSRNPDITLFMGSPFKLHVRNSDGEIDATITARVNSELNSRIRNPVKTPHISSALEKALREVLSEKLERIVAPARLEGYVAGVINSLKSKTNPKPKPKLTATHSEGNRPRRVFGRKALPDPTFDPKAENSFTAGKWGYDKNKNTIFYNGKHCGMTEGTAALLGSLVCAHPKPLSDEEIIAIVIEYAETGPLPRERREEIQADLRRAHTNNLRLFESMKQRIQEITRQDGIKGTISSQIDANDKLLLILPLNDMSDEERESLELVEIGKLAISKARHIAYYDGIPDARINKAQMAATLAFFIENYGQKISFWDLYSFYKTTFDIEIKSSKSFSALNAFLRPNLGIEIHREDKGKSFALCTKAEWDALITPRATAHPKPRAYGS